MLKITQHIESDVFLISLEGKLAGPWVKELELCWRSGAGEEPTARPARIDLSSVSFIDAEGKALLIRMVRGGAELVASGCLTRCIVEQIVQEGREGGRSHGSRADAHLKDDGENPCGA
ncbi:MAG: hypothetical protein AB1640_12065 [bacterium]